MKDLRDCRNSSFNHYLFKLGCDIAPTVSINYCEWLCTCVIVILFSRGLIDIKSITTPLIT